MTDSTKTFLKTDFLRKFLQFDKIKELAMKGFSGEIGQKSKNKSLLNGSSKINLSLIFELLGANSI
jgi:hypothetical protein